MFFVGENVRLWRKPTTPRVIREPIALSIFGRRLVLWKRKQKLPAGLPERKCDSVRLAHLRGIRRFTYRLRLWRPAQPGPLAAWWSWLMITSTVFFFSYFGLWFWYLNASEEALADVFGRESARFAVRAREVGCHEETVYWLFFHRFDFDSRLSDAAFRCQKNRRRFPA